MYQAACRNCYHELHESIINAAENAEATAEEQALVKEQPQSPQRPKTEASSKASPLRACNRLVFNIFGCCGVHGFFLPESYPLNSATSDLSIFVLIPHLASNFSASLPVG
jgi:hypothetical protein